MIASVSPPSSTREITSCCPSESRMMPKVSRKERRTDAGIAGAVMTGRRASSVPGGPPNPTTLSAKRFCTFKLCAIQLRHAEIELPREGARSRVAEAGSPALLRAVFGVARDDQAVQAAARPAGPHLPAVPRDAGALGRRRHHGVRAGSAPAARLGHAHAAAEAPRGVRPGAAPARQRRRARSEEHTSELQSLAYLVCRLLLEKKKK